MGSALATPFRSAGWEVNLWGTWLDDRLLEACAAGRPHPRTKVRLAGGAILDVIDDDPDPVARIVDAMLPRKRSVSRA